ncbi:MAG: PEP-utilizing enzyme [Acidimicrobiia bacterium]
MGNGGTEVGPAVPPTGSDPLHDDSGPATLWSRVNAAEAMPGVLTPLGWTFWIGPSERGARRGFTDMGIMRPADVGCPATADDRLMGVFFGRFAINVEQLRAIADLMPGTDGNALEQQMLGAVRPGVAGQSSRRRYPTIAGKLTRAMIRQPQRARNVRQETADWWRAAVEASATADEAGARALLAEALLRLEEAVRIHAISTFLCQALYETLRKLAVAAGQPGAEIRLTTGYGGMDEIGFVTDLWAVSRDVMDLEDFLGRHGYHGPAEGELSSRSWREDPAPLKPVIDGYRQLSTDQGPAAVEHRRAAERVRAERELIAAVAPWRRPGARTVLRLARTYIPFREMTKAAFVLALDGGRAAARTLGRHLAEGGLLTHPEDVFLLTTGELLGDLPPEAKAVTAERRRRRQGYQLLGLPDSWIGPAVAADPAPPAEPAGEAGGAGLSGIGASPGVYEGPVRVVLDPSQAEFDPGDVLVCETTDPSWAALFLLAGAVVTDIGGPISHGAIVARELGLPCVVNTRLGTRRLPTGCVVRVDGSTGRVEVLSERS